MWSEIQLKGSVGQRGGEGTNVEGIKRKGGEEGGSRGLWGERRGGGRWGGAEGGGGCIPPLSPLSEGFWTGRGPAEREGKGGGWRRGEGWRERGGAVVAFVCFPRFKASLEKWIDRGKSIAWPSQRERERLREQERGGKKEERDRLWKEGANEKERLKGGEVKWPMMFIPIQCVCVFIPICTAHWRINPFISNHLYFKTSLY